MPSAASLQRRILYIRSQVHADKTRAVLSPRNTPIGHRVPPPKNLLQHARNTDTETIPFHSIPHSQLLIASENPPYLLILIREQLPIDRLQ